MLDNTIQKTIDILSNLVQKTTDINQKINQNSLLSGQYELLDNKIKQLSAKFNKIQYVYTCYQSGNQEVIGNYRLVTQEEFNNKKIGNYQYTYFSQSTQLSIKTYWTNEKVVMSLQTSQPGSIQDGNYWSIVSLMQSDQYGNKILYQWQGGGWYYTSPIELNDNWSTYYGNYPTPKFKMYQK